MKIKTQGVRHMKKLSYIFTGLAFVLSNLMCIVVSYNYRDALCSIEHAGFSAPANIAFLYSIPFLILIIICVILAYIFHKKSQ